ncbi:MAG: Uma2 family endonuclease [Candidatus Eremiobacteraeota bacterium]|nr:Uma2 family endonuclease [Candidatus Eremiobacteraeota bacterium]
MPSIPEITVPITKPATEWVNGRALQKVSPQELHARVQGRCVTALGAWADATASGRVGTEWEFRVTPPHEPTRPLVPDVAFLSYERLGFDEDEAAQIPYMAPDVAIEIDSPDDRRADIDEKIRVYLASGTALILLIDPRQRTFTAYDSAGLQTFGADDVFEHPALAKFSVAVASVFEKTKPPQR